MIFGYARVSKGDDQNDALQRRALEGAGVDRIYADQASGGRFDRPELQKMLEQLRAGDVVVVWKLDRLSRSMKDFLIIMERIRIAGAHFRSITESIDTTTPAGQMVMMMLMAFAQFERAMIQERTRAGVAARIAAGHHHGGQYKLTEAQEQDIIDNVFSERKTQADMARLYKVDPATISRLVQRRRAERDYFNSNERKGTK